MKETPVHSEKLRLQFAKEKDDLKLPLCASKTEYIEWLEKQLEKEREAWKGKNESLKIINTVLINRDYKGAQRLLESIIYENLTQNQSDGKTH